MKGTVMINKIPIDQDELRKVQFNILSAVHKFCEENSINYSLAYGTLLGCIRHNGYIPWDDDIDIMMIRKDYDKFFKTFSHEIFRAINHDIKSDYWYPFGKVYDSTTIMDEYTNMPFKLGVNIDIFPVDSLPDSIDICKKLYKRKTIFNILHTLKIVKPNRERTIAKNLLLKISQVIFRCLPMSYIVNSMIRISKSYNSTETNWKGIIVASDNTIRERVPASFFSSYRDAKFESGEFKIIKEYDLYLNAVYGDYMTPPPLDQRITHHSFKAYTIQ